MATIKRNGKFKSMTEVIEGRLCGRPIEALTDPALEDPRGICNMYKAATYVVEAINKKSNVTIIGDYDADGLNASAILVKLFRFFGREVDVIIPRRISDGYGLSVKHTEHIKPGLVITVDNGIAAVDAVALLKKKGGYCIIVMDHHLPGPVLPDADLIVDPHVEPQKNGFHDYCGAGLAYQLSRLLLEPHMNTKNAQDLLTELLVHAAIATVADAMPLLGSNRRILMDGLWAMNNEQEKLSPGMRALLASAPEGPITEQTIGFTFGPIINAPARMYDAGGMSTMKLLTCMDQGEAPVFMEKMLAINEQRKSTVNQLYAGLKQYLDGNPAVTQTRPIVIYYPGIPEGLIGILAGKLSEEYQCEAVLFSDSKGEPGILKGSGRAGDGGDLSPVLERVRPMCVACGGHTGAMGISIRLDDLPQVAAMMQSAVSQERMEKVQTYDLPLAEAYVQPAFEEQSLYAPFGEGHPKPIVFIKGAHAVASGDSYYRLLGNDQNTLKLFCSGYSCLGFGMGQKYKAMGCPPVIDVIGRLSSNTFRGQTTIQVEIIDFAKSAVA